jgi:hypothetical protein
LWADDHPEYNAAIADLLRRFGATVDTPRANDHALAAGIDRAEQVMAGRVAEFEVVGPWSLKTSRRFWEGFTPAALAGGQAGPGLRTVFCVEGDWHRAEAEVTQGQGYRARGAGWRR